MANNAGAYFEVLISPPKPIKKNLCQEEQEILILAPFNPVPKISFERVKVNHEARRKLIIRNPTGGDVKVEMMKLPPEERHVQFSATQFELSAQEEAVIEVVWVPQEKGSWRDIVPIRTSNKFKTEFVIIYSSLDSCAIKNQKKSAATRGKGKPAFVTKKLMTPKGIRKSTAPGSVVQKQVPKHLSHHRNSAASPCRRQTFLVKADKENKLPSAKRMNLLEQKHHLNISQRFEDLVLSPISLNHQNQPNVAAKSLLSPLVHEHEYSLSETEDAPLEDNQLVDSKRSRECSEQQHCMLMKDLDVIDSAVDSVPLRRKTFAVTGGITELSETRCLRGKMPINQKNAVTASLTNIEQGIPNIYVHPSQLETRNEDEFIDSLEDCDFLPPQQKKIVRAQSNAADAFDAGATDVWGGEPLVMDTKTDDPLATSSFVFSPPLPSEDPRRCSTGVKVSSANDLLVSHHVRKDLFGEISTNDVLGSSYSIPSVPVDRLSTETYIKDRLSTGTYVKDRLSTETYIRDEMYCRDSLSARACVRENHSHGSDNLSTGTLSKGDRSNSVETLGSLDSATCTVSLPIGRQTIDEYSVVDFCVEEDKEQFHLDYVAGTAAQSKQTVIQISPPRRHKLSPVSRPHHLRVSPILKKSFARPKCPRNSESSIQLPRSATTFTADVSHESTALRLKRIQEANASSARSRRASSVGVSSNLRIPHTAQSRLSLSRSLLRTSQKVAKRQMERSEFLFNTDDVISQVMNQDPFATSTTQDPFLSCTLYCDDAWKARQEKDMIKWLNALLTPPAELDTNTVLPSINIAELWQQTCRQGEIGPAPSREEVSSDLYLKQSRLTSLRKAAVSLLKSPNVMKVLQKVSAHVDKKLIMVREDRDLHLDAGLKHIVLDLLLCYNPLWLRIGLEAIFGRTVDLKSNSDIVGLATFIVHNLLSDQHIIRTYSHPTVPHLMKPGFQDAMKKFTLKKFLFIVYFLDQAKVSKLIGHDPCLFMRNAKCKDSREILLAFSRELLKGVGDITRHLAVLGYKLCVKQVFLDEFEYGVKTLQDLRDGVRLVRVMELILQDHSLSPKLRVPAISKLQKIHNIDVALQALSNAGFVMCGDIQAKHLAEGHREKTLSFLWQLIYRFQAPRFTCAASLIQKWWRSVRLGLEISRRVRERKIARFASAATKIQAVWRAFQAKRVVAVVRKEQARERENRYRAAVVLQKHWRRCMAQKMLARACHASNTIKAWYCGAVLTRKLREDFLTKRKAVIKMQALCRGYLIRKKFVVLKQTAAALRIQTWFRRRRLAQFFHAAAYYASEWITENRVQKRACRTIQSRFRALLAMRRERARYLATRNAAVVIQNHFRYWILMKRQRADFLSMKSAAITIQQKFRALVAMRVQRAAFLKVRNAATLIQRRVIAYISMKKEKATFQAMRTAVSVIQRHFRTYIVMKRERLKFLRKRDHVIFLQRHYRAKITMRKQREEYLSLRNAAVYVQKHWRLKVATKIARLEYLSLRSAAITLQRRYRAKKEMEHQRNFFLTLRSSAVVIQQRYRANTLMHRTRCDYENLVRATIAVQRKWRALKAMSKDRSAFQLKRSAVIILQRRFRSLKVMKKCKLEFLKKRNAVTVLQQWWRAHLAMKQVRHSFNQMLNAACKIQRSWRAQIAVRKQRDAYRQLRLSTIIIQQKWRAVVASRRVRKEYVILKSAVIVVQRRWRAQQEMRHQKQEFEALRSVCIVVQRQWRSKLLMRRLHAEYLKLLNAVVTVQQKWRARLAEKKRLLAAVKIQKYFRAHLAMKVERAKYIKLQSSAVLIQRCWRSYVVMKEQEKAFKRIRSSAVVVQQRWRAQLSMRRDRQNFLQLLKAVVIVQRRYREILQVRQDRAALAAKVKMEWAAVQIQRYVRSFLARLRVRTLRVHSEERIKLQDSAARKVQSAWRRWRNKQKEKALKEEAAAKIQAFWRGYKIRISLNDVVKAQLERCKQAMQETKKELTLRSRGMEIMSILGSSRESFARVIQSLVTLDNITRISPLMCEKFVEGGVVPVLFNLLANANRSEGSKDACIKITSVLVNLVKYSATADAVWQEGNNVYLLLHLMKVWVGKENKIFLNCATIIWHFMQHTSWAQVVAAEPRLIQTLEYFAVKSKNYEKKSSVNKHNRLPSVKHTWCVRMQNPRPRTFENATFAVSAIAAKLKLII